MGTLHEQYGERFVSDLRCLLARWDPIGLRDWVPHPPADEYDDLLAPVAAQLNRHCTKSDLVTCLRHEMRERYGLDPDRVGVESFADELIQFFGIDRKEP